MRKTGAKATRPKNFLPANRRSTRDSRRVIMLRPGALLVISQFFHTLAVRPFIIHYYFLLLLDDYSQD
jgi:hypothetical protein